MSGALVWCVSNDTWIPFRLDAVKLSGAVTKAHWDAVAELVRLLASNQLVLHDGSPLSNTTNTTASNCDNAIDANDHLKNLTDPVEIVNRLTERLSDSDDKDENVIIENLQFSPTKLQINHRRDSRHEFPPGIDLGRLCFKNFHEITNNSPSDEPLLRISSEQAESAEEILQEQQPLFSTEITFSDKSYSGNDECTTAAATIVNGSEEFRRDIDDETTTDEQRLSSVVEREPDSKSSRRRKDNVVIAFQKEASSISIEEENELDDEDSPGKPAIRRHSSSSSSNSSNNSRSENVPQETPAWLRLLQRYHDSAKLEKQLQRQRDAWARNKRNLRRQSVPKCVSGLSKYVSRFNGILFTVV